MSTLPKKTREVHSNHFDSTVWNDFKFRDDDIVIATYAKSGTTWVQQTRTHLPVDALVFSPDGGAQTFVHKGTNRRWAETLTAEESEAYEARAVEEFGEECAAWLKGQGRGQAPRA